MTPTTYLSAFILGAAVFIGWSLGAQGLLHLTILFTCFLISEYIRKGSEYENQEYQKFRKDMRRK